MQSLYRYRGVGRGGGVLFPANKDIGAAWFLEVFLVRIEYDRI